MEKNCYVVVCQCYSEDNSVSVFYELSDAIKCMNEEAAVEMQNLKKDGYTMKVLDKGDDGIEIYVPDSDIYFNWWIYPTTIR